MFIVSRCVDSPKIDPTIGVIMRSCVLGFSAVASIKYSQIKTVQWQKEKNEICLRVDFLMNYNKMILQLGDQYNSIANHRHPKLVELKVTASCCARRPVSNQQTTQLLP